MNFSELLRGLGISHSGGDPQILGLDYDSRRVKPGWAFVAMRGEASRPVTTPLAFPNQHYNSITSWAVDSKGEIKHVYA